MAYRDLDPRTQLEQAVASDLDKALAKRGATVAHYGTAAAHAPATAPCDILVQYGSGIGRRSLMVEVAQRNDASEFQSIVSHLDAYATRPGRVDLLYSARSTSARMARLVRNENERRELKKEKGRIVFLKFDDLEVFIDRWIGLPADEAPLDALDEVFKAWRDCTDDLASAKMFLDRVFPGWIEKRSEFTDEARLRLAAQQERLKKDIVRLENQLRELGKTTKAHKFLIYLFFMALYEDKKGMLTRATREGFLHYRNTMPNADKNDPQYKDRTVHHLLSREILEDSDLVVAGIKSEYEPIEIGDDFVLSKVIPVFEEYSFSDASIDAIGAVFEALARRAEKDNRIGQFFTPETAVAATSRLAGLRPTDFVADPACGTGRFLIRAMFEMLKNADKVAGKTRAVAEKSIKYKQLIGCDIDPWVAVIAKMNMYIHGDGKSNIKMANGLTISSVASFAPTYPKPLIDVLDVVLTNPPLGDIDFRSVALDVARVELAADGVEAGAAALEARAGDWSKSVFEVVPHKVREELERDAAAKKAADNEADATRAAMTGDGRAEARYRRRAMEWAQKRDAAQMAIGAGNVTHVAAGSTAKGGALFTSSLIHSLKKVRDASLPLEWRGGVLAMIIDEAVLNTRDYAEARAFIRRNFFLKAIVSLPRDAFADLAKTTAKTSVLLLKRKDDVAVVQREPVFFARAFRIGPTGRDLTRHNDLVPICDAFDRWRGKAIELCLHSGGALTPNQCDTAEAEMKIGAPSGLQLEVRRLDPGNPTERLDEAYWCMKTLVAAMPSSVRLDSVADLAIDRSPPERDVYSFAFVSRVDVRVRPKKVMATTYRAADLQTLHKGDLLVSGIDLVHGSVGVVDADCVGMVVSKEYFILRVKVGIDAHWLVALLRTPAMRRIVEGTVTGTSNRTRVESVDVLMALPIPAVPAPDVQKAIGGQLRRAHSSHRKMITAISGAEADAAKAGGLAVIDAPSEPDPVEVD